MALPDNGTKPYYADKFRAIYHEDALEVLRGVPDESIDLLVTDPPYGISFMGKDWDKALPDIEVWRECLRVLKPGAFAFVMSIPRADCLSRMIISLEDAGFNVGFSPIYHAFSSGFPKSQNISLAVDKQECRRQLTEKLGRSPTKEEFDSGWRTFREVVGRSGRAIAENPTATSYQGTQTFAETAEGREVSKWLTAPTTLQAKALDGSYGGFQPKPAVEVIIVAVKPLSEKTYVDQALKNGKGITWLDDCRIPYESEGDNKREGNTEESHTSTYGWAEGGGIYKSGVRNNQGRFPANLLCSDDVLNDGQNKRSGGKSGSKNNISQFGGGKHNLETDYFDSGSFSRYFDLDKWAQKTFPFLIVPKASKSEKNKGCEGLPERQMYKCDSSGQSLEIFGTTDGGRKPRSNNHPTVKPLKLMSYLITLGSREGDVVLDPFCGSGTTLLAAANLGVQSIGIDNDENSCDIAAHRCAADTVERIKKGEY